MDATIWLFHGDGGRFAGGAFTSRDRAEAWIAQHGLSGVLTRYPVDVGVFDWAIDSGLFEPRKPHESAPSFIGGFTTASQEHDHYEDGICITRE